MKKFILSLLVLGSMSASANADFKCTVSYPNQTPSKRVTYVRSNDDGSLCTLNSGKCYLDIREVKIDQKTTALLIDGMGVKVWNVPTGFRDLQSFRGAEGLFSNDPQNFILDEKEDGVYKMGCAKI